MVPEQTYLHVDSTHLLCDHDDSRSLRSTTDARDSEELDEAREEVVGLRETSLFHHALFLIELCLDIVHVSCCLQRRVAESQQGLVSAIRLLLLEIPSRRFGAEVNADDSRAEKGWSATRDQVD